MNFIESTPGLPKHALSKPSTEKLRMKTAIEIREAIERELLSWPDVTAGRHRFGGPAFRVGKIEIGHLHGGHVAES